MAIKKIGVLTSGGDAPGMNCAVRSAVCKALSEGLEVVGVIGGYSGLVNDNVKELKPADVANVVSMGGTFLYTDRCAEFVTEAGMQKAVDTCKRHNIDAIIAIGGDGTFRGATDLALHGIPTVGVTGTIDNDITATDYTVGFDTAMNTVQENVDRIRETAESHARLMVVEVMGRHCGQIALITGITCGAIATAIPEVPFDEAAAIERVKAARAAGRRGMIVIVSEGCTVKNAEGREIPYGEVLTKNIEAATGVESRFIRLGHLQRGGTPTVRDRFAASRMAEYAVEMILAGKSNRIVIEDGTEMKDIDIVFALTADNMYKKKLKDGALDKFSAEDIDAMKAICRKREAEIASLWATNCALAK